MSQHIENRVRFEGKHAANSRTPQYSELAARSNTQSCPSILCFLHFAPLVLLLLLGLRHIIPHHPRDNVVCKHMCMRAQAGLSSQTLSSPRSRPRLPCLQSTGKGSPSSTDDWREEKNKNRETCWFSGASARARRESRGRGKEGGGGV